MTQPKAKTIQVETVGSKEEYTKTRAAKTETAPQKAATKKAAAPKKATAQKKTAAPKKAATKKAAAPKKAATKKAASEDLTKLTKAELRTRLDAKGIKYTTKHTKAALIAKLSA